MTTSTLTPGQPTATSRRPAKPNGWLVIGGIVTVLLIAGGALVAAGWLGYRTELQSTVYRQTATSIEVNIDTGDITLTPGPADTVTVNRRLYWSYSKPTVNEDWDGQTLRVNVECTGFWPGNHCGVDYTLGIPTGVPVTVRTSTGDIAVHDLAGALRLTASTGDITVTGASGPLALHTDTGDIIASPVSSSQVDASADTGDISLRLTAPAQTVTTATGTGDIHVVVPEGEAYHVETQTGTGDVDVSIRQSDDSARSITASTGTGDISINYR